jgi:D-alanyl-D-alanine carboxypeptidase
MCSGAFENSDEKISAYGDVKNLLLWASKEYTTLKVLDKSQIFGEIPVMLSSKHRHVIVVPQKSLYAFLPHDTDVAGEIKQEYEITEKKLTAPEQIGQKVGKVRLYLGGKVIASCDLVAKTQIEKSGFLGYLSAVFNTNMLIGIGIALIAACLFGIIRFNTFMRIADPKKHKQNK